MTASCSPWHALNVLRWETVSCRVGRRGCRCFTNIRNITDDKSNCKDREHPNFQKLLQKIPVTACWQLRNDSVAFNTSFFVCNPDFCGQNLSPWCVCEEHAIECYWTIPCVTLPNCVCTPFSAAQRVTLRSSHSHLCHSKQQQAGTKITLREGRCK